MEIKPSTIYGIIGKTSKEIKIELQELYPNKTIYLVKEELKTNEYYSNLYERMKYEIKRKKLIIKNLDKKIIDSIKIVGLRKEILSNNINTIFKCRLCARNHNKLFTYFSDLILTATI